MDRLLNGSGYLLLVALVFIGALGNQVGRIEGALFPPIEDHAVRLVNAGEGYIDLVMTGHKSRQCRPLVASYHNLAGRIFEVERVGTSIPRNFPLGDFEAPPIRIFGAKDPSEIIVDSVVECHGLWPTSYTLKF